MLEVEINTKTPIWLGVFYLNLNVYVKQIYFKKPSKLRWIIDNKKILKKMGDIKIMSPILIW